MELKTIRQVSQDYGISRQMLYYYEKIGLLKSNRTDDYAYRVYDEAAIKRLQQIIILRKLQIPVKQINNILNNQYAVEVIEIFKQNIDELGEKIAALSAVKSILTRFVNELREKADIQLKLDLLTDKTMLAAVSSLSFSENKLKEKVPMEELNKASETLNKLTDTKVRVVYLPPMMWAFADHVKNDPESIKPFLKYLNLDTELIDGPHKKVSVDMKPVLKKFIDDAELFKIKPDARVFGCNAEGDGVGVHQIFVSIPDDLDVPAPLKKIPFYGGLYAACVYDGDIGSWLENNGTYEWAPEDGINRPIMEELINPFNRYELINSNSEESGFMYADILWPIKEVKKTTTALKKLENSFSQSETMEIDLTTMVKHGEPELKYKNGFMEIKVDGDNFNDDGMVTPRQFKLPLKIALRAKTDGKDLRIRYANGKRIFNWWHTKSTLVTSDITDGSFNMREKCGEIPVDEFVDIEWIFGRNESMIMVNGEIRHLENDCGYIKAFREDSEFNLSSPVIITAAMGSTVTVESLRVTEI